MGRSRLISAANTGLSGTTVPRFTPSSARVGGKYSATTGLKAASGLHIAAFKPGIALASWTGGILVENTGVTTTPWAALVLVLIALTTTIGITRTTPTRTSTHH
ncbi:MAG: MFS transporter [Rhodococcus sp. (in: high G+C Gram-positive bacteria)]|nr:MAG: MFS transporter [Rhodococcus sp. (in: high G+C Gram-positive bacteria)]